MTALEMYNGIFTECFQVEAEALNEGFTSENVSEWDSIGHMNLIAMLEETFNIFLESEDIMELNSYENGKTILKKYNINI